MTDLSAPTKSFLDAAPHPLFIGGQWQPAGTDRHFSTRDPGTGEVIADVAEGDAEDVDRAVKAADGAFREWADMPVNDRAVLLHRLADLIDERQQIIAEIESLDVGKPRAQAGGFDAPFAANTFRYYADLAVQTRRREPIAVSGFEAYSVKQPYGPCAFIFPWNFPFLLISWGIAPALAAGNTVIIKPAEDTPLSTVYFAKMAEEVGFPPGVINVVTGYGSGAGAALSGHAGIKRMSFTGSPEVGKMIGEACGRNLVPAKLELGGKGAAVVFDDVDVDASAQALAEAVTLNAGQVCCTATRWLVHDSIRDKFIEKAGSVLEGIKIGYGAADDTDLGPVVSEKQRDRILGYLDRGVKEGATALLEGGAATVAGYENGYYVKPALLAGDADNPCCTEEIFGPVAYVLGFQDEAEAIDLVNRSPYGLANSVWSNDLDRANRVGERLVAGNSWINAHNVFALGVPYGACNLSGCGGGVLGPDTLEDYYRHQSLVRPLA